MDLTDEALIESFRRTKDPSHFKSLVQRYQNRIYNAAFRILGSTEEAEEVVQDTFIKVHQNVAKFQRQSTFASWVFRIAHNLCVDLMRARQRRRGFFVLSFDPQAAPDNDDSPEGLHVVSQVADRGPTPAQMLDSREQAHIIEASLRQLPDSQRTVVVLHDIEGFSYQEISDIVGANLGTVRSRLHYGRLKLRELLEPYFSQQDISPAPR
ncbi:MAG TPA: RNA polymerase sigma factor [Candidatus Obscuribacterales bacterium]